MWAFVVVQLEVVCCLVAWRSCGCLLSFCGVAQNTGIALDNEAPSGNEAAFVGSRTWGEEQHKIIVAGVFRNRTSKLLVWALMARVGKDDDRESWWQAEGRPQTADQERVTVGREGLQFVHRIIPVSAFSDARV